MREYKLRRRKRKRIPSNAKVFMINGLLMLSTVTACFSFVNTRLRSLPIYDGDYYLEEPLHYEAEAPEANSQEVYLRCFVDDYEPDEEESFNEIIEDEIDIESLSEGTIPVTEYQAITDTESVLEVTDSIKEEEYYAWDSSSVDILNVTGASEEQFDAMVDLIMDYRNTNNSAMSDISESLVYVEEEYGISGTAILAIITWESDFGDNCANYNNLGGIKINGYYASFNSVNECILYIGELMNMYVYSYDLSTWEEIGSKYCDYTWAQHISNTISEYNDTMYKIITEESTS